MECVTCYGCDAQFEKDDSKIFQHPYIGAIPECWHVYSEILGREYSEPEYFKVHRITVDAYAAQHSGHQRERRGRQSACGHLIALYLMFGKQAPHAEVLQFLRNATSPENKQDWPLVEQVKNPSWLTVQDVLKSTDAQEHAQLVTAWGKSVWDAYVETHDGIAATYDTWVKKYGA